MQVNGQNYLIPVGQEIESEDEVPFKAIDVGLVLSKMESAGTPLNMVFLDACRNNPFARSFRSGSRGLAQIDAPTGSLIVYATAPGSVASDGDGRNGLFTQSLLKQIGASDVDVEIMLRRVRQNVVEATGGKQVPWSSSSLTGAFVFNSTGRPLQTVSTSSPPPISSQDEPSLRRINGVEVEISQEGDRKTLALIASGRSESSDTISRRVFAQKEAEKKLKSAVKELLTSPPYLLSSKEARRYYEEGEIVDLEYRDDGREVLVTFEMKLP